MRLTALDPIFLGAGGDGVTRNGQPMPKRLGVGLMCNCPCGCESPLYVPFANPLDGGPQLDGQGWRRTGETFETLSLAPSILRSREKGGCGWHGFITNGEVLTV